MRRLALTLTALLLGIATVPLIASVGNADGLDGLVTGEAESYALHVEYDIPLPVGAGAIPHTIGEIRRTTAGENAKGLAAAPTHFEAVVAGAYATLNNNIKDPAKYNRPPQAECFYPGALVDTAFVFPTDTRKETANVPPISKATAQCNAGPSTRLIAATNSVTGPGFTARGLESISDIRTENGVAIATSSAHASGIYIAGGAIRIGSVGINGSSSVTGKKGGAKTDNGLSITDIFIGGLEFSIADNHIVLAGQKAPLSGNEAQGLFNQANKLLKGSGCTIDAVDNPARYPQGFLFSRPEPKIGVAEDGSFAASMRGGLVIVCDLPQEVTGQLKATGLDLSPQRVQFVVGFAFTSASAKEDPGGFGIGDLGGTDGTLGTLPNLNLGGPATLPDLGGIAAPTAGVTDVEGKTTRRRALGPLLPAATTPLDSSTRSLLLVICLVIWAALTHLGITRLRRNP